MEIDAGGHVGQAGPVYSVGEAARLAGISASTIRLYEREGLLRLRRTPGGHRCLGAADLNLLKRIRTLRRSLALPLEEIRQQLRPEGAAEEAPAAADSRPGPHVRALRHKQGKTLGELARQTGLSTSFLAAFERGETGIAVANLQRVVAACGSSLVSLFAAGRPADQKLVKAGERPRLVLHDGQILVEDLAVVPRVIEIQLWTIQPGAGSEGSYAHEGEEAMFLLRGQLEVQLDETQRFQLEAGDCLYFASSDLHRWHNAGPEAAVVVWVNTPPTF